MTRIESFENMLNNGQDNALLRYSLGNEYFREKQFDKAFEHLQQALKQDENYSAAWKLMGKCQVAMEQPEQAKATYREGIRKAEEKGDLQAAKEMQVFLKRLDKA